MSVVGILGARSADPARPFGGVSSFIAEATRLGRADGIDVVAFAEDDIGDDGAVRLARALPEGGWRFDVGPMPSVVWSRSPFIPVSLGDATRLLNQPARDKWTDHTLLSRHPSLRPSLPDTVLLTCGDDLRAMLARHEAVFLKPIRGSLGRGISRIRRAGPGRAVLESVSPEDGSPRRREVSVDRFDAWCEPPGVRGQYIAQQGLELCRFEGRPFDIRVLVQKDGSGRWSVTGSGVRVAGDGRFTTNLHTGGHPVLLQPVLRAFAPGNPGLQARLAEGIERLALEVCGAVEREIGPMGELGLDVALDVGGNLWYIEHNTQPGRGVFEQTGRGHLLRESLLRPLRYARWLQDAQPSAAAPRRAASTTHGGRSVRP